jgi:hypothetical protein
MAAAPADTFNNDEQVRAFVLCVRRTAVRLEPSGESPTDIADAAKAFCQKEETVALNSARDIKGGAAVSISEMENGAAFYARAQVVAARLCRRTKDCALNHVP